MPAGWWKASLTLVAQSFRSHPTLICHSVCSCRPLCSTYILTHSLIRTKSHFLPRSLLTNPFHSYSTCSTAPMNLSEVLDVLEELAPLALAEPWDNVGLLVEPSKPRLVKTVLLTNDLTASVMEEAEAMSCDLIVSYHPPLFRPIKRLVQKDWKQRLAIRAIEAGIAVYSPHTSLDCVRGGVNDWLIAGVGRGKTSVITQAQSTSPVQHRLMFSVSCEEELDTVQSELSAGAVEIPMQYSTDRPGSNAYCVSVTCSISDLSHIVEILSQHTTPKQTLSILQVGKPPVPGCGQGRMTILDEPITVATAIQRMKSHLGLSHLRLALGAQKSLGSTVGTVAVCAGSGSSVLHGVNADLYVTGEMSHHEVLDAVASGTSVILSDHSNSERGFLSVFKERMSARLSHSVSIHVSQRDKDPLEIL